jgi:hypothetical protein
MGPASVQTSASAKTNADKSTAMTHASGTHRVLHAVSPRATRCSMSARYRAGRRASSRANVVDVEVTRRVY